MDKFTQVHGVQCNSKGWDISDTTLTTKSWTLKPEISSKGHSKGQGGKKHHFGNAAKRELQDLFHCQNLKASNEKPFVKHFVCLSSVHHI